MKIPPVFSPSKGTARAYPSLRRYIAVKCRARAFTLVEVVAALGIVSFGLIGMMGLLSAGIQTFREAIDSAAEARITQHLATQLSQAPFSALKTKSTEPHYFTREGAEILGANADTRAIYSATVSSPSQLQLPGAAITGSGNVLTFVITIKSRSDSQIAKSVPIQVANYGG